MLNKNPPLPAIVDGTRFWSRDSDQEDLYTAYTYDQLDNDIEYGYTTAELCEFHPKMASIIDALIVERISARQAAYADGLDVLFSIELQQREPLYIETILGKTLRLSEVLSVGPHHEKQDRVYVGGYDLTCKSAATAGGALTIVTYHELGNFCVMKTELELKYPGWESRWSVGDGVGLGKRDLMHHIFRSTPLKPSLQTQTIVSGVTFE